MFRLPSYLKLELVHRMKLTSAVQGGLGPRSIALTEHVTIAFRYSSFHALQRQFSALYRRGWVYCFGILHIHRSTTVS